jgi:hypothetical protein
MGHFIEAVAALWPLLLIVAALIFAAFILDL